ncbi:MAG: glycine/betaine ABC transporter substrate-binding protein [Oscillospiraceae bacterium]|nr:glycine/betaine ABC transporter substrate-binding protein [Oscillospiraceae bacterium]
MRKKLLKAGSLVLAVVLVVSLAACAGGGGSGGGDSVIRVGSKDFTESLIVAEIYALALEDAGFTVDRTGMNLSSGLVHEAITSNEIDLYPEYTGTGLLTVLGMDLMTDPMEVYELVSREYYERYQITWLNFTTAHNGQGIAIRTPVAQELGIRTISDLQPHAHTLRFVSTAEFLDRGDGLPAMVAAYGPFDFASVDIMGGGARYEALRTDAADVSVAFTTDGHLYNEHYYTLLVEDIVIWPPYNLIPIVRNDALEANPGIAEALNRLAPHFTTYALLTLNSQVIVYGRDIEEVAREFFESVG